MKILITGGSGMLGRVLTATLSEKYNVLSLFNSTKILESPNYLKLDITRKSELKNIFEKFCPNIVIHTAAISTPADADKLDTEYVNAVNVTATENIAKLCKQYKSRLFYTSTDLVYDGNAGSLLDENAKVNPISFYAKTKLLGEEKIQNTFDNYVILRTSLMLGIGDWFSKNHFNNMYLNLKRGEKVNLFTDQFRSPMTFYVASDIIKQILEKNISKEIINFGGSDKLSRYQLGELLCDVAGFDKSLLNPVLLQETDSSCKVYDVSMNIDKLTSYGVKQKDVSESIKK